MGKTRLWARYMKIGCMTIVALTACSKSKDAGSPSGNIPDVEVFPIANHKLTNCHFKQPTPVYAFNARIEPNVISCDEGVPKRIEVLTPSPLPSGLVLDLATLSLQGTAKEKVSRAAYVIYLENEAGYVKIPLSITVQ
jgi:hypothetical protein